MDELEYTEQEIAQILNEDDPFTEIYCFCCTPAHEHMVHCNGDNCEMEWFHAECVGMSMDSIPDTWMCDECKEHSKTKQGKKITKKEKTVPKKTDKVPKPKHNDENPGPAAAAKTKRRTIKEVQNKFTKDMAMTESTSIILEAIRNAESSPIAQFDPTFKEDLNKLGEIIGNSNSSFCEMLIDKIWPVISSSVMKPTTEELDKMCTKFHCLKIDVNFLDKIRQEIVEMGFKSDNIDYVIQTILQGLIKTIMSRTVKESSLIFEMPNKDSQCEKLSEQEELALRYTAGYIIQSQMKHYAKNKDKNKVASAYFTVLSSWQESQAVARNTKTFLSYTKKLVEYANRGGLFCISDNVYIFFRRMEIVVKPFLQKSHNLLDINLKEQLFSILNENRLVQLGWETICNIENDSSQILKEVILKRWIKLRLHAFAHACIFLRKIKDNSVTSKTQKGLRKQLKLDTEK